MAGTEQEQLLALIRDCVSEKSQGERRLIGSKKRDQDLHSELEIVNAEVDQAKRFKESAEQKLKGYEIELSMLDASVQTMQSRNSLLQNQISAAGSELEKLKNQRGALRDDFIRQMLEVNSRLRNFHQMVSSETAAEKTGTEVDQGNLDAVLTQVNSEIAKEAQAYQAEENVQKQIQLEYGDLEGKISLVEMIMKESEALQDLRRQTSELEQECTVLGDELQK
ncbi:unnamed protein product [Linum tenue]|uniref:Uncharacterized protein n=1 Tax=Linum tenue TaxID=586396 RepID=A0AAV0NBP8_9ROSI|nr:unnamed protein product [Linum tenue]